MLIINFAYAFGIVLVMAASTPVNKSKSGPKNIIENAYERKKDYKFTTGKGLSLINEMEISKYEGNELDVEKEMMKRSKRQVPKFSEETLFKGSIASQAIILKKILGGKENISDIEEIKKYGKKKTLKDNNVDLDKTYVIDRLIKVNEKEKSRRIHMIKKGGYRNKRQVGSKERITDEKQNGNDKFRKMKLDKNEGTKSQNTDSRTEDDHRIHYGNKNVLKDNRTISDYKEIGDYSIEESLENANDDHDIEHIVTSEEVENCSFIRSLRRPSNDSMENIYYDLSFCEEQLLDDDYYDEILNGNSYEIDFEKEYEASERNVDDEKKINEQDLEKRTDDSLHDQKMMKNGGEKSIKLETNQNAIRSFSSTVPGEDEELANNTKETVNTLKMKQVKENIRNQYKSDNIETKIRQNQPKKEIEDDIDKTMMQIQDELVPNTFVFVDDHFSVMGEGYKDIIIENVGSDTGNVSFGSADDGGHSSGTSLNT